MKISLQFRIKVSPSLWILCYTYFSSQQQEALEVLYANPLKTAIICSLGGFCRYCCSCSEWRMFLRKAVTLTVCMWCLRIMGRGLVCSAVGRSFENKLHSVIRWRDVCTAFLGHMQVGEGVFFILWRYDWKVPGFVKKCVRMKLGQREMESLCKMVGMKSLVWDAFTEFIQGVTGETDQTSGECSLGQTIPI